MISSDAAVADIPGQADPAAGGYLGELRDNIRPLAAAAIGSASGLMVAAYTTSIFSPYLIAQFHWSKSLFSLIGLTIFATLLVMPMIGRLTDRFGVRPMALTGALLLPLCFLGYSLQQGQFWFFMTMSASVLVTGSTTTPAVWCRMIAENFHKARGLALFIVTGAPALMGALLPRVLLAVNDHWGWRWGYRALALYFLVGGLIAVALVPRREPGLDQSQPARGEAPHQPGAFGLILRKPAFWIITGAMMLCLMPTQLHAAQMIIMLLDVGMPKTAAADAVSAFAIGGIAGRALCGLALDRLAPRWVAAVSMILPALGYVVIAMNHGAVPLITGAMFLVGLSYGAEGDLPSFLVARHFPLRLFSSASSLVYCGILFASASGALILAAVLKRTNAFSPFLMIAAVSVALGSLLFLALPRQGLNQGSMS